MAHAFGLGAATGFLALCAIAVGTGSIGLLPAFRQAPRRLAWASAGGAAACTALAAACGASTLVGAFPGGVLVGLLLAVGLACLRPVRPDDRFLPGFRGEVPWIASECDLPGEPDAGALVLVPRHEPRSERPVVVLLHGGGNDRMFGLWPVFEALLRAGCPVVAAHLPGHGKGGRDWFEVAATRRRTDRLVELAQSRFTGRRVALLGQSMGGLFVLDAAARALPVDSFAAVSVPNPLNVGAGTVREAAALLSLTPYRALRWGTPAEVLPAFGWFRRSAFPVRVASGSYLGQFRRCAADLRLEERLADPKSPPRALLLVHGEKDSVAPVEGARRLALRAGPRAELWVLPGRRHLDPLLDPAVVSRLIEWLGKVEPGSLPKP